MADLVTFSNSGTPGSAFLIAVASAVLLSGIGVRDAACEDGQMAEQVSAALQAIRPQHPYLFVTADDVVRLRTRTAESETLRNMLEKLRERAERILGEPPVERTPDKRSTILGVSRRCLDRVRALGMLFMLTGEQRYADRGKREMFAAAAFEDWHPAHFLDTAEMSHALAIGYDWLYPCLSLQERDAIVSAIVQKGLEPYLEGCRSNAWWSRTRYNWNQVCHGGCGIAALAIAHDRPDVAEAVLRNAVGGIPVAMASYAPDGGWGEGPGYWHYATSYTVGFLASLYTALGTDFGLSELPGFSDAGDFRLHSVGPTGFTFNFADAGKWAGNAPEMFWLARRFNRPTYATYEQGQWWRGDPMALMWFVLPEEMPVVKKAPLCAFFSGVNVAFLRSGWDRDAIFVGFKGGDNRVNHGQLDLGTFVLDADGVRWAMDLGRGDYALPAYFGDKRWTYYQMRTESHNVVCFGGQNQDTKATAAITAFHCSQDGAFGICDLGGAYSEFAHSARRGVALLGGSAVLVQDEIQPREGAPDLQWGFVTEADARLEGATALLEKDGKTLEVVVLEPVGARLELVSTRAPEPQNQNEGTRRVAFRLPSARRPIRIAVVFQPGRAEAPAPSIAPLSAWSGE